MDEKRRARARAASLIDQNDALPPSRHSPAAEWCSPLRQQDRVLVRSSSPSSSPFTLPFESFVYQASCVVATLHLPSQQLAANTIQEDGLPRSRAGRRRHRHESRRHVIHITPPSNRAQQTLARSHTRVRYRVA